jgi:hypothetical protein
MLVFAFMILPYYVAYKFYKNAKTGGERTTVLVLAALILFIVPSLVSIFRTPKNEPNGFTIKSENDGISYGY